MSSTTSESVFTVTRLLSTYQPPATPYSRLECDIATNPVVMGQVGPSAFRNLEEVIAPFYPVQVELAIEGATDEEMTVALFKAMDHELMRRFIEILDMGVLGDHTIIEHEALSLPMMNVAFVLIEEHELIANHILISPSDFATLTAPEDIEDFLDMKPVPRLWTADFVVHDAVPAGRVYTLPVPKFLGYFCAFEPRVELIDGPKGDKIGTMTLDCGMAVNNDYSFTRTVIDLESVSQGDEAHSEIVAAVIANPGDLGLREQLAKSMLKPLQEHSVENN